MKNLLNTLIAVCFVSLSFGQITWTSTSAGDWDNSSNWSKSGSSADSYPGETTASLADVININHDMDYNLGNGYPTYASANEFTGTVNVNSSFTINSSCQFYVSGANSKSIASGQTITIDGGILVLDGIGPISNLNLSVINSGVLAMTGSVSPSSGTSSFNSGSKAEIMGQSSGGTIFMGGATFSFNSGTAWTEDDSFAGSVIFFSIPFFAEGSSFYLSTTTTYQFFTNPVFQTGFSGTSGWRHMNAPASTTFSNITNLPHVTTDNGAANIYQWDATPTSDTAAGWTRVTNSGASFGGGNPAIVYLTPNTSGNYQPGGTVQISGQAPFNSNQAYTLYRSHDPLGNFTNTDRGWNLIGNPYPSNLDLEKVSDGFNLAYKAIHTWDVNSNQYKVFLNGATQITHSGASASSTSAQYVRPWQAFWVKMESGDGSSTTKTITRSMRDNGVSSADYFKTEGDEEAKLRLFIHSSDTGANAQTDEALIYFNTNSSEAFEPGYDAIKKFSDVYGIPSLYMKKFDENNDATPISIYSNAFEEDSKVPVYFRSGVADTYTLSFSEEGGFAKDVVVIDHKLNTRMLYTGQEISFDYAPTDNDHRFTLEFSRKSDNGSSADAGLTVGENGTTSIDDLENESGLLNNTFVQGEELIVAFNLVETSGEELIVEVVDLTGRTVFSQKVNGSENLRIPTSEFSDSKFVLVTVSQEDGSDKESRKVVLW